MHQSTISAFTTSATLSGNPASVHQAGQQARKIYEQARATLAQLLQNADERDVFFAGSAFEATLMLLTGLTGTEPSELHAAGDEVLWLGVEAHEAAMYARALASLGICLTTRSFAEMNDECARQALSARPWRRILVEGAHPGGVVGPWHGTVGEQILQNSAPWSLRLGLAAPLWPLWAEHLARRPAAVLLSGPFFGGPEAAHVLVTAKPQQPLPLWLGGGQQEGLRPGTVAKELAHAAAEAFARLAEPEHYIAIKSLRDGLEAAAELHLGARRCSFFENAARLPYVACLHGPKLDAHKMQRALWHRRIAVGQVPCPCGMDALVAAFHPQAPVGPADAAKQLQQALADLCNGEQSCALASS